MAEYVVNSPIYDVIVLRTTSGTAITGKTAGSFDTLEAYALPSGATTAAVTLTEIGNGEYGAAFTPTAAGTWVLHYVYDGDSIFLEATGGPYVVQTTATLGASVAGVDYTTAATLKLRPDRQDSKDDAAISAAITAASRAIDGLCGRVFYQDTGTRYFTADDSQWLDIDDLVSVTTLQTDDGDRTYGDTWATSDYDLTPDNAAAKSWPYTCVTLTPAGDYAFPVGVRKGVKITGTWGWPAVPDAIGEATIILALRLLKRKDTPFGVAGTPDMGLIQNIPRTDPDVVMMVAPFRRLDVGAI